MQKKIFFFVLIFLITTSFIKGENPETFYQQAIESFNKLDLNVSYKIFEGIIKFFPETDQSKKARIWRMLISSIQFSSLDMLKDRYVSAVKNSNSDVDRYKNLKKCMEISERAVETGKVLVNDTKEAIKYVGYPVEVKMKKEYDSLKLGVEAFLPIKMLEQGRPLDWDENQKMEEFQNDSAYRYILGKILNLPSSKKEELIKEGITIEGKVDWPVMLTLIGNWLIRFGELCRVGWVSPYSQKNITSIENAKIAYETAKICFEKVISLSEGNPSLDLKVNAEKRIQELNTLIKSIK